MKSYGTRWQADLKKTKELIIPLKRINFSDYNISKAAINKILKTPTSIHKTPNKLPRAVNIKKPKNDVPHSKTWSVGSPTVKPQTETNFILLDRKAHIEILNKLETIENRLNISENLWKTLAEEVNLMKKNLHQYSNVNNSKAKIVKYVLKSPNNNGNQTISPNMEKTQWLKFPITSLHNLNKLDLYIKTNSNFTAAMINKFLKPNVNDNIALWLDINLRELLSGEVSNQITTKESIEKLEVIKLLISTANEKFHTDNSEIFKFVFLWFQKARY